MNILVILIVFIHNEIVFSSSERLLKMVKEDRNGNKDIHLQRSRRDSMPVTRNLKSVSGYSSSQPTSAVVCRPDSSAYPLQSIMVSNIGSTSEATLTSYDQPNSIGITKQAQGSVLVFENLPISQSRCYLLNFRSRNLGVNPIDIRSMKVQFFEDTSNAGQPARSTGLNNGYESYSLPYVPNTYSACGSLNCQNGGTCRYTNEGGYQCQCNSTRWLGNDCSKQNPCQWSPCNNQGLCYFRQDATYFCACYSGYSGANCKDTLMATLTTTISSYNPFNSYNPCLSSIRCSNGGTCIPQGNQGSFICICRQGYIGVTCQTTDYSAIPTAAPSNTCGTSSLALEFDRIVGGKTVTDSRSWPWIVSLQTANGGSHFCGGTLIDAFHVITAAHCFDQSGTSPERFQIVAGFLNMRQLSSPGVQKLSIERIFRHEQYNQKALVNDITIIKLRTAAKFNEAVSPICLPGANGAQDPKVGDNVYIAGWGYTDSRTKQIAVQLQQATIQILDINGDLYGRPGCNAWIRQGYSLTNDRQICAMSADTRKDSCQGDSGGPLIYYTNSRWYISGIVSYGDTICASSTSAGVYTRVSAYGSWIQQQLKL